MSDLLPLFPLPNVVLFPAVFLPLHVFEPRYREMVADALASDRLIGIVLLRPGWEGEYEGRPPVYEIGCTGVITHVERLNDGRYNIVLRGVEKFRVLQEDQSRKYRLGLTEPIVEHRPASDGDGIRQHRMRLETLLTPVGRTSTGAGRPDLGEGRAGAESLSTSMMPDEDLVNALAQYLDLEPIEKQALLERPGLRARAQSLVELLEMKAMVARSPWMPNFAH